MVTCVLARSDMLLLCGADMPVVEITKYFEVKIINYFAKRTVQAVQKSSVEDVWFRAVLRCGRILDCP